MMSLKAQILNQALERGPDGITVQEFSAYGFRPPAVREEIRRLIGGRHLAQTDTFRKGSKVFVLPVYLNGASRVLKV